MPIPCVQNQRDSDLGLPWFNVGKTPDGAIEGCKSGPTYSFTLQNCCANCTGKPHDEQSFCIIIISGLQVGDRFNGLINGVYHGCAPEGVETSPFNRFARRAVIDLTTNTTTANYVLHRSLKYFQSGHSFRFGYAGINSATDPGGFGCGYIINDTRFENLRVRARKFVGYQYKRQYIPGAPPAWVTNSITRTWSTTHVRFPRWKPSFGDDYDTLAVFGGSMRSTAREFNNGTTKTYGPNQAGCLRSVADGGFGTPTDFPNWLNLALLPITIFDLSGAFNWSTKAAILQTATVKYYSETLAAISTATITINKIKRMPNAPTTTDAGTLTDNLFAPKCPGNADYALDCGTTVNSATLWFNCNP